MSDENVNHNLATEILQGSVSGEFKAETLKGLQSFHERAQIHATLAVADELRKLNETLLSFAKGEAQGGRSLEVNIRSK